MAARNRLLRIAALIAAGAFLLYAVRDIISSVHVLDQYGVEGGYVVSAVIFPVVHLLEACGFLVLATALGREIEWRRFLLGGAVVAAALILDFVSWICFLLSTLDKIHNDDYRLTYVWTAVAALLLAVGAGIFASGLAPSRRGEGRSLRLWLGMILASAALTASTVAVLYTHSFYSDEHAVHVATIGVLVQAVGAFGLALAALTLTLRIRRPLGRREAALAAAAAGATVAALCIAGGEIPIAIYASSHGVLHWQGAVYWLACAYRIGLAAAIACVTFGARRASVALPAEVGAAPQ